MCEWGNSIKVPVRIPEDLSHNTESYFKLTSIDSCIADLVIGIQSTVDMRGSCCGHGKGEGFISLQDGRVLLIYPDRESAIKARFCGEMNG